MLSGMTIRWSYVLYVLTDWRNIMFEKYQSLPKTVEAVQFTEENKDRVFNSLTGQYAHGVEDEKPIIKVTTIHGEVAIVRLGDWIIKENKLGHYYPIKDDIFRAGYV
jgi:hypothetical protein